MQLEATRGEVQNSAVKIGKRTHFMSIKVADVLWEMLANAGVKRCYGVVGDALNPVIDALRCNGKIDFVHVRHEEYGVFAAVEEAYLSANPVAVLSGRMDEVIKTIERNVGLV